MENKREFDEESAYAIATIKREYFENGNLSNIDVQRALVDMARWQFDQDTKALEMKDAKEAENIRVLQELTGSNNNVNPWLGIAAGVCLMKNELESANARIKELEISLNSEVYRGDSWRDKFDKLTIEFQIWRTGK